MTIVHLEPEEFVTALTSSGKAAGIHCIVLDNAIAAVIYTCVINDNLYYMDRITVSFQKEEEAARINPEELHAEVYRKMALDTGCGCCSMGYTCA